MPVVAKEAIRKRAVGAINSFAEQLQVRGDHHGSFISWFILHLLVVFSGTGRKLVAYGHSAVPLVTTACSLMHASTASSTSMASVVSSAGSMARRLPVVS